MELPQVISSSRLRRRLYQTLRDKGVIQELKTNLRHKLISEFCASNVRPSLPPTEVDHLQKRLYEGIIADYLSNRGYMYTLSVFIPEMGLQTAQVYSRDEILKFLKLSDTPRLTQFQRRRLFDSEIPLLDVLVQFLEEIYGRSLQNIGIQAGSETGVSFYESQLQRIDQKFQSKHLLDIETTRAAFEDRIRHCRYEIETELQRSFSEKLENFKKLRLEEMRQEVEANMSEQFSAKQQQLEALHAAERARLDEREKHLNELAQKSREVSERTAFLQRQALEAEIQAARAQTEKARAMESELERQRRQMQEDFERQRMQLDMERNNLLEKKQSFDDIVRQEVERLRKTDELDLLRQRKNLEVAEARILVEKDALDAQKKVVLAAQDEASRKLELFSEMEIADYKSLKLKATAAANEVNLLQSRLAQAFEEIERLKEASADAASERNVLMASRQETERLRSCLDRERSNSNNERMKLQLEIDQLTGENQRLKERVRLQENELSRLRGRLADLRSAPTDSGQLKQKRTNEQSWTTESVKNVVKESPVSSQETAGTKPDANFQGDAVDNRGGILNSQPSAAFLAARERLESLERESRELEKAYSEWRNCSTYTKVENSASSARPPQHAKLSNSLSAAFFTGLKSTSIPTLRPFTTQWPLPYMRSLSSVVDVAREPLPKTILETRFLSSNLPNLGDYAELSGPEAKNNEKPGEMNFQQSITKPNPRPVSAVGATNSVSRPSDCSHQLAVETDVGNGLTSKLEDHHFSAKCHADGKPSSMSEQQNVSPLSSKPASSIYPAGDEVHASALKFRPEERPVESSSGATVFPPIKELLNQKEPLLEINDPPSGPKRSERFSSPEVISDNQEAGHEQQQQLQQEMVEDAKQNYLPADDNNDDGQLTSESSQEADLADENSDAAIDPMILKYMAIVKEQQKSLQKQLQQQKESGEGRGLDHGKSFNQQEHPVNATKPTFEDFLTNDQFESDRSARNESVLAPQPASKAADDQSEEKDNSEDFW
uniref:Oral-facial-digital syndrome 1 protein n=4 Tax=Schistocephalus solidus TaxID=70667 RepID=A0A0X3PQE5_SCHSO